MYYHAILPVYKILSIQTESKKWTLKALQDKIWCFHKQQQVCPSSSIFAARAGPENASSLTDTSKKVNLLEIDTNIKLTYNIPNKVKADFLTLWTLSSKHGYI